LKIELLLQEDYQGFRHRIERGACQFIEPFEPPFSGENRETRMLSV
jgi:hypothetical protein